MNNHLQLCRVLFLHVHGILKPISIWSTSQGSFSRSCSCSPALLEGPGWLSPCCELWAMLPRAGLAGAFLLMEPGWVSGRLAVVELLWRWVLAGGLGQHRGIGGGCRGSQGVLNPVERWGCRLHVALSRQGHKFVPFTSAEGIKHAETTSPGYLSAFG